LNNEALVMNRAPRGLVPTPRTAAHGMLEIFARRGIRAAFGIPGGLVSSIYDAVADEPRISLVHTRHEAMAAFSAMGHALVSGTPALVMTTSGPGITNAITGIAAAHVEGIPMVVVAGEVPATAASRGAIQDATTNGLDAVAMLRTITRFSARVDSAVGAAGMAEHAMRVATGPRPGPVFLSLPLDVGGTFVGGGRMMRSQPRPEPPPDEEACRVTAMALSRARRPLLVVGNGARGAARELRLLAERLAIPVVTTPHAKGIFPESHVLSLGGIGLGADPAATDYLRSEPDVVLICGSRLGDYATNGWSTPLTGSQETIQIDREALLIGRNYPVTLGLVGDVREALTSVLAMLPCDVRNLDRAPYAVRTARVPEPRPGGRLAPARVLSALQAAFPEAMWTVDQGEHCAYAIHHLRIEEPDRFRTMVGLASMGSGIGIGIGAAHALRGRRRVIALCGDGCFAMHPGEVLTCVEHGIDVVFVVFNDGRWNMVHHGFKAVYGRMPERLPAQVADIAGVAASFGAASMRVETEEDLGVERLRAAATPGRPVLFDIRFDPSVGLSVASRSAALRQLKAGGAK
jgi:acetolactate synthase-1/2/3 large subunit